MSNFHFIYCCCTVLLKKTESKVLSGLFVTVTRFHRHLKNDLAHTHSSSLLLWYLYMRKMYCPCLWTIQFKVNIFAWQSWVSERHAGPVRHWDGIISNDSWGQIVAIVALGGAPGAAGAWSRVTGVGGVRGVGPVGRVPCVPRVPRLPGQPHGAAQLGRGPGGRARRAQRHVPLHVGPRGYRDRARRRLPRRPGPRTGRP